jgi:hypothetical protein
VGSVNVDGSSPPLPTPTAFVYDNARARTLLFENFGTWEWDGIDWVKRPYAIPFYHYYGACTYDIARARVVLFGGRSLSQDNLSETYEVSSSPAPPRVLANPQNQAVPIGGSVTLTASADGEGPFSFQWFERCSVELHDGESLATPLARAISGATTPTLTLRGIVQPRYFYETTHLISCRITNPCGTITTNNAILSILPCGTADFNNDGATTDADIDAFFACLAGNCCGTCGTPDFNGDGDTGTDQDIEAFFRVLAGGTC